MLPDMLLAAVSKAANRGEPFISLGTDWMYLQIQLQ